jgi:hypothetical protein
MRRVLSAIMEMALANNAEDNSKQVPIKEAYSYFNDLLDDRVSANTTAIHEALVVGDFPVYFARTLSRMVYDRYNYRVGVWRDYTYADTLPDYTAGERLRFSEFDTLVKRREKQEPSAGYIYEFPHLTIQVEDYAKQIDFSNRILVNDDLGAFNNIGIKMGDSARRFEDFYVSSLYDNALTQAQLVALGALYSGTGRLSTANLAIGWNAFAQRVDARGNLLNIVPKYLVIPPVLELTARQILTSAQVAELATNGINPLQNAFSVKVDPYIGFTSPNVPWYLLADPSDIQTIPVVRMAGRPGPRLFAKAPDKMPMSATGALGTADWRTGSFLTGDIELLVETTIGARNDSPTVYVGVADQQGIYYSSGTTP